MSSKFQHVAMRMLLVVLLLTVTTAFSYGQEFPVKPIEVSLTVDPGAATNTLCRVIAAKAEKFLGQPIIVSNRPGGGGSVAMSIAAKEKPDGYHLVGFPSFSLVWLQYVQSVSYKLSDFVPIMQFGVLPNGLVVNSTSPWKTLKDFTDYAKKNPGKISYATTGAGQPQHLAMEYVAKHEGIQWTMVPYSGGGMQPNTALLGGHVDAFSGSSMFLPYVKEGTWRLLAVYTEKRMKQFPNVPTLQDLGYNFVGEGLLMFAAPKGTPQAVVNKLDEAFHKGMADPEFTRAMERLGAEVGYRNSRDAMKYLEVSDNQVAKVVAELMPKAGEKK